jgi:hypothetical protein
MSQKDRTVAALAAAIIGVVVALPVGAAERDSLSQPRPPAPDYTLRLGEMSFDPLVDPLILPAGWEAVDHDGSDLRLVQLAGPTQDAWLDDLQATGVEIVQYIHPYTYIVWGKPESRDAAGNVAAARWSGDFAPAFRVLPRWRDLPDAQLDMRVTLYRGADTDAIIDQIAGLGAIPTGRRVVNKTFEIASFTVSGAQFREIARIPGVYTVKPVPLDGGLRSEMSSQINAGNYDAGNLAFPGYMSWLAGMGRDGAGVVIANVDGGVQDTHPDLVGRLIGCSGVSCGGGASSGHGTHTAGIMAGDGTSGTMDSFGFLRGLGVAPGASLVEQVYSPYFTQPGGMLLLMSDSYNSGASLSGNSWGPSGSPLGYDDDTMQVDVGTRDTDPARAGDQPLLFVLSFMNGNGGTSSQGTPDEAKNIFNIGSTKMQTGSGAQILQIDDMSANSAHGPALDGRTIPHMVAPGCQVDSTYSGSGYALLCGTSMASPQVSGAVALFIDYYRGRPQYIDDPSPALVKAAFLPVAHDLAGHHDADGGILGHPFDSKQGWGRLALPPVVMPDPNSVRYCDQEVVLDNTGEEWSITLSPLDPGQPVKLMLVWTDAPGHGLGGSTPAWNNDLDLVVEAGGTYYGNNFGSNGYSISGGSPDDRNNTEGVFLGPIPPGSFTVRVVASNINSDGLPNVGDLTDQDFALVAYNVAEEPGFAIFSTPTAQDLCAPGDALYSIDLVQILGYAEPVTLSASGLPAGVTGSFSTNPVVPPATVTFTASADAAAPFGQYAVTIEGNSIDLDRSTNVSLTLANDVPTAPTLTSPANGAVDVARMPTLAWQPATQGVQYDLQVATSEAFTTIVYSETVSETSHTVGISLNTVTQYFWRVRATNPCGDGGYSMPFAFTTLDQADYFTEEFLSGFDLDGMTIEFYPDGSGDYYGVCGYESAGLPTNPAGGITLPLSDDDSELVTPASPVLVYGTSYATINVGSNGYITLGGADTDYTETLGDHFDMPRVSALFDDLNPSSGGTISWKQAADRVIVTWQNVPEYSSTGSNTFQVEMFFDGPIHITWAGVSSNDSVVGLSGGGGIPFDYVESDLSQSGPCPEDCPADIDGSGVIDVDDLTQVILFWGDAGGPADINNDGIVNVDDLTEVILGWGPC